MQYLLLWVSGVPNWRTAPSSPHSSYATDISLLSDVSYTGFCS